MPKILPMWFVHAPRVESKIVQQNWQKLQIKDLLNKMYPKGQIKAIPIGPDKIRPKNSKKNK